MRLPLPIAVVVMVLLLLLRGNVLLLAAAETGWFDAFCAALQIWVRLEFVRAVRLHALRLFDRHSENGLAVTVRCLLQRRHRVHVRGQRG